MPGRDNGVLGIGAASHRVGHAVAHRDFRHALADRFDDTRRLHAEAKRRLRLIQTRAEINVDKVDARIGDLDQGLTAGRGRRGDVGKLELLRSTGLFDEDCFHRSFRASDAP